MGSRPITVTLCSEPRFGCRSMQCGGASGTGKTLADEILTAHPDPALYRADLSAIVSKYIGETEKHPRRFFAAAEGHGVILLFDEANA